MTLKSWGASETVEAADFNEVLSNISGHAVVASLQSAVVLTHAGTGPITDFWVTEMDVVMGDYIHVDYEYKNNAAGTTQLQVDIQSPTITVGSISEVYTHTNTAWAFSFRSINITSTTEGDLRGRLIRVALSIAGSVASSIRNIRVITGDSATASDYGA